jgi:hypothetical protein
VDHDAGGTDDVIPAVMRRSFSSCIAMVYG